MAPGQAANRPGRTRRQVAAKRITRATAATIAVWVAATTTVGIAGITSEPGRLAAAPTPSPSSSVSISSAPGSRPNPTSDTEAERAGANNSITDVPGITVGSYQRTDGAYLTGTTVVHAARGAVGGVDQRGGAPGTRETDLLSPLNANSAVNAVMLTGGSAYGLDAAGGVMSWLEQHHQGVSVGPSPAQVVPIVPAAVIFDLGRGGSFEARPTAEFGTRAISAAGAGPVVSGTAGAGTGARAGGIKGGLGTASVRLPGGDIVGAIVIVNAAGSATDPSDCSIVGVRSGLPGEFAGLRTPSARECLTTATAGNAPALNTTIAVVATNAALDKAAAARLASAGQDGLARAITPAHSLVDGDTVFALSTGEGDRLSPSQPSATNQLDALYAAAARTLTRAIAHAVLAATSARSIVAYCDRYASACAGTAAGQYGRWAGPLAQSQPATPSAAPSGSHSPAPGISASTPHPTASPPTSQTAAWVTVGIAGLGVLVALIIVAARITPHRGRL